MDTLLPRLLDPASLRPGATLTVTASDDERERIAAFLDLLSLDALSAEFVVEPLRKGEVRLDGHIRATYEQRCVVSLQPVAQVLDEEIHRRFVPEAGWSRNVSAEEVVRMDADDPPDPYPPSGIDIGAVVVEHLALSLDLYPKAPGVTLEEQEHGGEDKADSPFAILKSLGHSDT